MVKQRMSTADIAAMVGSLRSKNLVGMRVLNVYDVTPKVYAIKFARGGDSGEKAILLIESGMRMHTIDAMPEKSDVPSNFTLKLRKHVRSRRLEDMKQLGSDRVVQLTFGSGESEVKLLLEFYASGNIILVSSSYQVLTLLRSHRDDAKGTATMAQHTYPIQTIKLRTPTPPEAVSQALNEGNKTLKDALSSILSYGPQVAGFCIQHAGLQAKRKVYAEPLTEDEFSTLMQSIRHFEKWIDSCEDKAPKGCISYNDDGMYHDFQPLVDDKPIVENVSLHIKTFPTFDDAVREFFSKIQGDRSETQTKQQEDAAKKKLESIRKDHADRIKNLNRDVDVAELKANVLQCNLNSVDAAIDSVKEALAAGISWGDLDDMIRSEKQRGNPVALLIHSLKLDSNTITVSLQDIDSGDNIQIDVDLSLTAHANVSVYYDLKKKYADKARRTLESNEKALAAAESKFKIKLQKIQQQQSSKSAAHGPTRKPYWFEKFHWFISSENYLVVSGRDAQQNEQLVKRYLRKGDVYVHAELHGASSTIIKNNTPDQPIPLMTLNEAGQACVARSAAWDAKVVASAYWVYPEQVSKTAPSGEYLTTGSMMIRGRKNYLPPQPLVMGLGWLFKLEEGSIASHLGERAPRSLVSGETGELRNYPTSSTNKTDGPANQVAPQKEQSALEKFLDSSLQDTEQYSIISSGTRDSRSGKKKVDMSSTGPSPGEQTIKAPPPNAAKRGAKSKKAAKKKYKDQDDEERELAMALLQSHGEKKSKDKKARRAERKAKLAARKAQASGIKAPAITQDAIENLTARLELHDDDQDDSGSDGSKDSHASEASDDHDRAQGLQEEEPSPVMPHEYNSKNDTEEEHVREMMMKEEGVGLLNEQDIEKLTMLDELTGIPRPEDTILAAIPVCAPYQVVSSYKYHIKLVPGTQKKGKAYKQAVDVIKSKSKSETNNQPSCLYSSREVDMIQAISETEGINAMVGSVKLQVAGLQKLQQKQKMAKKSKKNNTK